MSVQKLVTVYVCENSGKIILERPNGTADIDEPDSHEILSDIIETQDFHGDGEFADVKSAAKEVETDGDAEISERYMGRNPFESYKDDEEEEEDDSL